MPTQEEVGSPPARDDEPAGALLTPRAVALGILMCAVIGLAGPYWTFFLHSSTLFLDYSVGGAVFLLFVLVLVVNGGVGMLVPRLALRPGELIVVTAMMLIGGAITTMGLVGYLIPNISAPYYLATPSNAWRTTLWPALKPWMSPLDPDGGTSAITKFFNGVGAGEPIPWAPWVRPLLLWSVLLVALYACMTALMAIMRKQWVDHEHLSFPIAQVPAELCAAAAHPWRRPSVLVSKLFWIGFGLPFVVGSLNGLHFYFPRVPGITISRWIGDLTPISISLYLSFAVLGFTFLIPNRVAFSLWFLNLLSFAFRCYLTAYGLDMKENLGIYGAAPYPIMAHQGMGAMLVFIGAGVWFSRRHLLRVVRCALGAGEEGYDAGEPTSYRSALALLVAGVLVMAVWTWRGGLSPLHSIVLVLAALLIFYGLTRVVAQCGVAVTIAPMIAPTFLASTFGSAHLSRAGIGMVSMSWVWASDIRTSVMGSAAHGMYLARRRARHLLWVMLLAAAVTYATACLFTLRLGYEHGAANLHEWFFLDGPQRLFQWAAREVTEGGLPRPAGYAWTGVGAAIMLLLVIAQRTVFWWPIHPVGFVICSVTWTDVLWLSVFLAWLIKLVVVRVGGPALYRRARFLFLGMILGQFTVAGAWAVVDTFTGSVGNSIFWI
ncbi:MAG: hypothetical protein AMK73_01160 [Planctomycetes bacterium SM23_32]|nr:MAG: hypothetical protein AMK73_01160 [Planctomycetes bacterium SM23_32]